MTQVLEVSNPVGANKSSHAQWIYLAIFWLPLLALRIAMFSLSSPQGDFITYWAAGHLFLTHGDPYSASATFAIEHTYGWSLPQPYVTFCPPWTLPIQSLMALLPFHAAKTVWLLTSLSLNAFSAVAFWNYFGGAMRRAWIAILVALTLLPMGGAELLGQITPLILASLAAFLLLTQSRRYFLAGLALYGCGPKPHLLYLVALAILLWMVKTRAWTMLAGAALSYGAATTAAILYNPHAQGYIHATLGAAVGISCGVGGALRSVFGVQHAWLQFLPSAVGATWFAYYWVKHQRDWNWQEHLPLLLIVSVCTSPYCWYHDFILILPALLALAVRGGYRYAAVLGAYLATQVIIIVTVQWSVAWMCVASLLWTAVYAIAKARLLAEDENTHR